MNYEKPTSQIAHEILMAEIKKTASFIEGILSQIDNLKNLNLTLKIENDARRAFEESADDDGWKDAWYHHEDYINQCTKATDEAIKLDHSKKDK